MLRNIFPAIAIIVAIFFKPSSAKIRCCQNLQRSRETA